MDDEKLADLGHISLMTVALSFIFENLPENKVVFAMVNQRRGITEVKTRGEDGVKHWTFRPLIQ